MNKREFIEERMKRFNMEFLIERITKIDISDEQKYTYVAKPTDLKGHEAKLALESFLRTALEEAWTKGMYEIIEKRNKGEI